MRLIDFDKLIELYSEYFGNYTINELKEIREENMPFTKAIPIEWIVDWLTKQTIPATSYGLDCSAIHKMLDDWEKENELV